MDSAPLSAQADETPFIELNQPHRPTPVSTFMLQFNRKYPWCGSFVSVLAGVVSALCRGLQEWRCDDGMENLDT